MSDERPLKPTDAPWEIWFDSDDVEVGADGRTAVEWRNRVTETPDGAVLGDVVMVPAALLPPSHDWPAFWSALTPQEVAAALRAAPKVAEPWVKYGDGWHRDTLRCGDGLPVVEAHDNGWWQVYGDDHASGNVRGAEAAKAAADAALRAAGWVLL